MFKDLDEKRKAWILCGVGHCCGVERAVQNYYITLLAVKLYLLCTQ